MTYTIDFVKPIAGVLALLLAFGVLPFTAGWVGAIIILSMCSLTLTWHR